MEINQIKDKIAQFKNNPKFLKKGGTPEFWGDTIGRPSESIYKMKDIFIENASLIIILENSEKIIINNPSDFILDNEKFIIPHSDKVIFQWYYYGKPQTEENLYYFKYEHSKKIIKASSNVTWFNPAFKTNPSKPAFGFFFWN